MDIKNILGKKIKFLRYRDNLTREELAEKIDLSSQAVGLIEAGKSFVSGDVLEKLVTSFDISSRYLFDPLEIIHKKEDSDKIEEIYKRIKEIDSEKLDEIYKIIAVITE